MEKKQNTKQLDDMFRRSLKMIIRISLKLKRETEFIIEAKKLLGEAWQIQKIVWASLCAFPWV